MERQLPINEEAEQAVLGAVLLDPLIKDELDLVPGEFGIEKHGWIWDAMLSIEKVDPVTLEAKLRERGQLAGVGGMPYILELIGNVVRTYHAEEYARIVKDNAIRRRFITAGSNVVKYAWNDQIPVVDVISRAESEILAVDAPVEKDVTAAMVMEDILSGILEPSDEQIGRVFTGIQGLDSNLMGIEDGRFIVTAAVPETGKSALSVNVARGVCELPQNVAVLFFHPEQPEREMTTLLLSTGTEDVSPARIKMLLSTEERRREYAEISGNGTESVTGGLTESEWKQLRLSQGKLHGKRIAYCDPSRMDILKVRSRIRRERARLHPDTFLLVIFDGMHLLSGMGEGNRVAELTTITRNFKISAMNDVTPGAIWVSHQLNRLLYANKPRVYSRHHLRDSGTVEQDADVILFLDRPSVFGECPICGSELQTLYLGSERTMGCPKGHNITSALWDGMEVICKKNRQTSKHWRAPVQMNVTTMKVRDKEESNG